MFAKKDRAQRDSIVGLLGKGTRFDGKLIFEGTVHLDGNFSGEVHTEGMLVIGDNAVVRAQITADTVIVHGEVHGNISATKCIEIRIGSRVYGDVTTPSLVVDEGAMFEGNCGMKDHVLNVPECVDQQIKKETA